MTERKEAVRARDREECGNCRFWSKRTDDTAELGGGYCRRYPPFAPSGMRVWMTGTASADIEPSSGFLNDEWPNVHQSEWCGEFQSARPSGEGKQEVGK